MPDERFDDIADVYEGLHRDSRKSPIPEDVMDVTTRDGLDEARQLVNYAIHQKWTSVGDLARRTGFRNSAISEFRNNKWKGKAGTEATVAGDLAKTINAIIRTRHADDQTARVVT